MNIPANIIKCMAKAFISFSNELVNTISYKLKSTGNLINSVYAKLAAKCEASYKNNNLKLPINYCLIGFQLFSILRTLQTVLANEEKQPDMNSAEWLSLWSGIMGAITLMIKSFSCGAFVANIIKTKEFKPTLKYSARFKTLRSFTAGFMRLGNRIGAIGSIVGAISISQQKTYNSIDDFMKKINIIKGLILTVDYLCQAFSRRSLVKLLVSFSSRFAVFAALGRFVSFMLHPLIGLAVFILSIVVSLVSDNPLQSWFKSNRMGKNYYIWDNSRELSYTLTNYSYSFKSYQEELDTLHEIFDTDAYKQVQRERKETADKIMKEAMESWKNYTIYDR